VILTCIRRAQFGLGSAAVAPRLTQRYVVVIAVSLEDPVLGTDFSPDTLDGVMADTDSE
jgi:hypothetical protein